MKKQEIMTNCLKQMIFDEFLSLYAEAIKGLLKDQNFYTRFDRSEKIFQKV